MDWLIRLREEAGMRQIDVARAVRITKGSYSHYECGRRIPRVDTAKKIAEVLGFDWTRFFEDKKEEAV